MVARPRILVVEPFTWLRESIGETLIRGGYLPCLAATRIDALRQAVRCPPSAVLVDCQLDEGTGVEFIRELRKAEIFSPVVGLAGRADSSAAFLNVGAKIVKKPFTSAALLAAVRAAITP